MSFPWGRVTGWVGYPGVGYPGGRGRISNFIRFYIIYIVIRTTWRKTNKFRIVSNIIIFVKLLPFPLNNFNNPFAVSVISCSKRN